MRRLQPHHLFGERYSHLLASYLDLHRRMMRPHTAVHAIHVNDNPAFLADVGRRSVCVVFDFRRYQRGTIELARAASNKGAKIILITDPWWLDLTGRSWRVRLQVNSQVHLNPK